MLSENNNQDERLGVDNHYTKKLKASGYNQNQCKDLLTSGVTEYRNKIKNRKKNGQPFYRSAKSTLGMRSRKKLTEKSNWYRKKKTGSEGQVPAFRGLNVDGRPYKQTLSAARQGDRATSGGLHGGRGLCKMMRKLQKWKL